MVHDTKAIILDTAEALFAKQGFAATSLRAITAKAGANLASVNYHFGSKEALIETVFERRIIPMNQERVDRLNQLQRRYGAGVIPLELLIEAYVGPALDLARETERGGALFIKLLGRSYTEPNAALQNAIRKLYAPVIDQFREAFSNALPELPREELYWRMHFMVGLMAYMMAGTDMMSLIASCRVCDPLDTRTMIKRLGAFITAGMRSPPPDVIEAPSASVLRET
jgi:AcrR family transcriptional regulator